MMLRPTSLLCVLFALFANGRSASAETLRAADVITASNVNWMAFARAQRTMRAGGSVQFVRHDHPETSYAHIRRELWIAALHGLLVQTNADDCTGRLLADELALAERRLKTPFAFDIAVRDVSGVDDFYPRLVRGQMASFLVNADEKTSASTILRCEGTEVESETAGITFTSFAMAVSFSQSCNTDNGLVFERDGRIAQDLFVRRFKDGTSTVVNLTDAPRPDLTYCRGLARITFDLHPAGVIHITSPNAARLTRDCGEVLSCGLWLITFADGTTPRLVSSELLPSVVKETYTGSLRYQTHIIVPRGEEAVFLHLDTNGAETEVFVGGHSLGIRAWEPFEWMMPLDSRGKNAPVEIRVEKKTIDGCLQGAPVWHRP